MTHKRYIKTCPIDDANHEDVIWLAGLLEGEGSFGLNGRNKSSGSINLTSTDKDVVERAAAFMGTSAKCNPSLTGFQKKVSWRCSVSGYRARRVMEEILSYMGKRRATRIIQLLCMPNWGFLESGLRHTPETKEKMRKPWSEARRVAEMRI